MAKFHFKRDLESNVETEVVAWAENHGWLVRKMQYVGRRGCPDRFFFGFGVIVMIEFKKSADTDLDVHQAREHRRLKSVGLLPLTFSDAPSAISALKGLMK